MWSMADKIYEITLNVLHRCETNWETRKENINFGMMTGRVLVILKPQVPSAITVTKRGFGVVPPSVLNNCPQRLV